MYDHAKADLLLRHGRLFGRDDIWQSVVDGVRHRTTVATLSDPAQALTINLHTEFVEEYLVLRMTYVTPVNRTFLID
jgi:hypothetical protein